MATFTLHHGSDKPLTIKGKNACRMVEFAERNQGWHTYKPDRATRLALAQLVRKQCVDVKGDQFRFRYPR